MRRAAIFIALAGCFSSRDSGELASLKDIELTVPAGWAKHDLSAGTRVIAEWTPTDNERKESITVISARAPSLTHATLPEVLATAQRGLPAAAFVPPTPFVTSQGLAGFRVDGSFVPAGKSSRYYRIHAAVFDPRAKAIVHVLYTALDPEPDHFQLAIDNLVRKGA